MPFEQIFLLSIVAIIGMIIIIFLRQQSKQHDLQTLKNSTRRLTSRYARNSPDSKRIFK